MIYGHCSNFLIKFHFHRNTKVGFVSIFASDLKKNKKNNIFHTCSLPDHYLINTWSIPVQNGTF